MFQMTLLIYWVIVVLQFQNQLLNEIVIAVQQYYNTHIHTCTTRCPEGTHVGYMNPTWHTWYFRSFDCCTLKPHQFPTRLQLFYFIASYNKSPLIFTTPVCFNQSILEWYHWFQCMSCHYFSLSWIQQYPGWTGNFLNWDGLLISLLCM